MPFPSIQKSRLPFRTFLISVNLLLFAFIAAAIVAALVISDQKRDESARNRMRATIKAMESHIVSDFKSADLSLQGFSNAIAALDPASPSYGASIKSLLTSPTSQFENDALIVYVNTEGIGVAASNGLNVEGVSYTDRDYFQVHARHDAEPGPFVGQPTLGKISGRKFVPVSRKVVNGKGVFLGVLMVALDAKVFADMFADSRINDDELILLVHRNGRIIARIPDFEKTFGIDLFEGPLFDEFRRNGPSGIFRMTSRIDKKERLTVYHEITGLPMIVAAGLSSKSLDNATRTEILAGMAILLLIGAILTVTARTILTSHANLEKSEARYRQLYSSIHDGVCYTNMDGMLVDFNDEFMKLTGFERLELSRMKLIGLIPEKLQEQERMIIREQVMTRGVSDEFDTEYVRKDGVPIAVNVKIWLIRDEAGAPVMMGIVARDVTKRRALAEKVAFLAQHDVLTGLINRASLNDRIEHAMAQARRRGEHVAIIFIDLDGFKQINDQHGHASGDAVLKAMARRMTNSLRASDTACRFGGDEFIIVLPDLADAAEAERVAQKIVAATASGIEFNGRHLPLEFSFGIAIYPRDGTEVAALLHKADSDMYRAKMAKRAVAM